MKILQIRGCNLASLFGAYAVDLEGGPLGRAGLFAITGPTGAGKTTLLDTLCLALFNNTPRLNQAGRTQIGRGNEQGLTAQDPRSLLRDDAGKGYAEAEFEGRDGHRYRARWSVHRSRNRPGGRLQATRHSLEDLTTGEQLGGTASEIRRLIEERLGLDFHQFQRSALLAQGDFSAFLRSDPKERAALLERMTGTEIYASISRAAHLQKKEGDAEILRLTEQLGTLGELPEEQRQALGEQAAQLSAHQERVEAQLQAHRLHQEWAQRLDSYRDRERTSAQRLASLELRSRELAPGRQQLERAQRCAPLRDTLAAQRALATKLERYQLELATLDKELTSRTAALPALEEQLASARTKAHATSEQERGAQATLERARTLDAQLTSEGTSLARQEQLQHKHQGQLQEMSERLQQLNAEEAAVAERQRDANAWLEQHPQARRLLPEWPVLEERLGDYQQLLLEQQAHAVELRNHQDTRDQASQRSEESLAASERAQQRVEDLSERLAEASSGLGVEERRQLRAQRDALHQASRLAEGLVQLARLASTHDEQRDEAAREARAARARHGELLEAHRRQQEQVGHGRARLSEARANLRRTRSAQDLSELRRELEPGCECPLCGSTDHPWADHGAFGGLVAELEQRCGELESDTEQALAELHRLAGERDQAEADAERQRALSQQHQQALEQLRTPWDRDRRALAALGQPGLEQAPQVSADDTALILGRLKGQLAQQAEREAELEAREGAQAKLRQALEQARETAQLSLRTLRDHEREAASARQALSELRATQAKQTGRLGELTRDLRARWPQLPDTQAELRSWLRAQEQLMLDAAQRERALAAARDEQQQLAERRQELDRSRQELDLEREQSRALLHDTRARLADLQRARDELGITDPQAEAQRLRQASEAAALKELQLSEQLHEHRRTLDADRSRQDQLRSTEREERLIHQRGQQRLQAELDALGLELHELQATLAIPPAQLAEQRQELETLDRQLQQARGAHQAHREQLRAHQEQPPPAPTGELQELQVQADQLQEQLLSCRVKLKADADNAAQAARLRARLTVLQRQQRVWDTLNSLIGSADGHKFRKFAQGLTLDVLLQHANHQLKELAPRYLLVRVPGQDLDIQVVDRDLGDDVRSVASLSGGETFMASLALALGLSSMASADTRVETLFIDEGFGSLDRNTLDSALATLEALQATGRKVGVISHVDGIGDRVGVQLQVLKSSPGRSRLVLPQL